MTATRTSIRRVKPPTFGHRNLARTIIFEIILFAIFTILLSMLVVLDDPAWFLGLTLIFSAGIWELLSWVSIHPVEFGIRTSFGARVPIQLGGILKEGLNRKWPWEKVEVLDHQVQNGQGEVQVITATATSESSEHHGRGVVNLEFTYQWRPHAGVADAQGRLRYRELSAEVIAIGIKDRLESELIDIASEVGLDEFLGSTATLEIIARSVVELEEMPHRNEELVTRYGFAYPITSAAQKLLFYKTALSEIQDHLENQGSQESDDDGEEYELDEVSPVENRYGVEIIQFMLTSVLPSDAVAEALEAQRKAEAFRDAIVTFTKQGHPLEEARRLALATSHLSTVTQVDVSGGGGATPLVFINPNDSPPRHNKDHGHGGHKGDH